MSTENPGFSTLSAQAMPLDQANVDTDQIIPKQFLTSVSKVGFGRHLFHNWRYSDEQGQQDNPEFVLNLPQHKGSEILLARENFGCGSSREHAPWSLTDYGFKVVIATSFADIFYGNCMNNQLLPVALSSEQMDSLFAAVAADPALQISIDLPNQRVNFLSNSFEFTIAEHHKHNLMLGLDAIGQTLQASETIDNYEKLIPSWRA